MDGRPIMKKDKKGNDTETPLTVTDGEISAIVQNMEKLISFTWGQFRFVDSYAFLSSSLDQLVRNSPDLSITQQSYPDPLHLNLMTRKGVYPYEHMDSFERFDEMELPAKVWGIS